MSLLASGKVSEGVGGKKAIPFWYVFLVIFFLGKQECQEQHAWGCVSLQFCIVSDGAAAMVNKQYIL